MSLPKKAELDKLTDMNVGVFRREFNGFTSYNYRNIHGKMFYDIQESTGVNVFEARGITFGSHPLIPNIDVVIPSVHKFFNVNEVEQTQLDVLKKKELVYLVKKRDGSLIHFVPVEAEFGNFKYLGFIPKTKGSFDNIQCTLAKDIYDKSQELRDFIRSCFVQNMYPIFELVGASNPIVVREKRDRLVLIAIRDQKGRYLADIKNDPTVKKYGVECDVHFKVDLDTVLRLQKEKEGIEGWVALFNDRTMVKFKTDWYVREHRTKFSTMVRENDIIHSILDETIDDAISVLDDKERINEIYKITDIVNSYFCKHMRQINNFIEDFNDTDRFPNRKSFYEHVRNYEYNGIVMAAISLKNLEVDTRLKEAIKRKTLRLELAKQFLKEEKLQDQNT